MENKQQTQPQTEKQTPFLKRICNLEFEVCKLRKEIKELEDLKRQLLVIKKSLNNRG